MTLASPALPPGPRLLALGGLHLLLRLLLVLLALHSLVADTLALVVILTELEMGALFYCVVEVDVRPWFHTRGDLVLVPVVDVVGLIREQLGLVGFQAVLVESVIQNFVLELHEVVVLDLLADLATSCDLAVPGITLH